MPRKPDPLQIIDSLNRELAALTFAPPVSHVYNPLTYALAPYSEYIKRYGDSPREIILLGMNPGPWGMVQTGIPFGDVRMVQNWLKITSRVGQPERMHPKRPVTGFNCRRREVSGERLWGWAKKRYGAPSEFFRRFLVINYCPLAFMEESGRNRTPDKLRPEERHTLFAVCDKALIRMIDWYQPRWAIGIGRFTEQRLNKALADTKIKIGHIPHPSPANPAANRHWSEMTESILADLGILPDRERC